MIHQSNGRIECDWYFKSKLSDFKKKSTFTIQRAILCLQMESFYLKHESNSNRTIVVHQMNTCKWWYSNFHFFFFSIFHQT